MKRAARMKSESKAVAAIQQGKTRGQFIREHTFTSTSKIELQGWSDGYTRATGHLQKSPQDNYEQLERESIIEEQQAPESATEFPFGHNSTPQERAARKEANPTKTSQKLKPEQRQKRARLVRSQRAALGEAGLDYLGKYYGKAKKPSATRIDEGKRRRQRGTGSIFRKPPCKLWVIQFYRNGRREREATGSTDYDAAKKMLRQRLHEIDQHRFVARRGRPARVRDLYEALRLEREVNQRGRKRELPGRWRHLGPAFGAMLASEVTTNDVLRYARARQGEGAANATINRELATLKRMFRRGAQSTPPTVQQTPYIPMLKEANARSGFVEDADFDRLAAAATDPWLRAFIEVAYTYAWRAGEILPLRVRQLNFANRTIRLDTGTTKNKEGREVMMTAKVFELLRAVTEGKEPDAPVFTRRKNGQQKPVRDMRDAWAKLLKRAGLSPSLIVHDFRRSGAKAMRRAGVPQSVIMNMGGWKTDSVFRRYAIVSSADQAAAVELIERARAASSTPATAPLEAGEPVAAVPAASDKVQ